MHVKALQKDVSEIDKRSCFDQLRISIMYWLNVCIPRVKWNIFWTLEIWSANMSHKPGICQLVINHFRLEFVPRTSQNSIWPRKHVHLSGLVLHKMCTAANRCWQWQLKCMNLSHHLTAVINETQHIDR